MTEMASPALPTQEEQVTYLKNAWSNSRVLGLSL